MSEIIEAEPKNYSEEITISSSYIIPCKWCGNLPFMREEISDLGFNNSYARRISLRCKCRQVSKIAVMTEFNKFQAQITASLIVNDTTVEEFMTPFFEMFKAWALQNK